MDVMDIKLDDPERYQQAHQKIKEMVKTVSSSKKEIQTYQNMLEQLQTQYMTLERKYIKAKQLLREYQQRELDMMQREDFYQQLLQEKDTDYNALVKSLKDRIIVLEHNLLETQRQMGLPPNLPLDETNLKQLTSSQINQKSLPKPLGLVLEADLSDTEFSDISPERDKRATVERKIPLKEELDNVVPQHELLDISANKSKADLANRGALANRQLPSSKKGSLSNSSSECGLDECYSSENELNETNCASESDSPFASEKVKQNVYSSHHKKYVYKCNVDNNQSNVQYSQVQKSSYVVENRLNNFNNTYTKSNKESSHCDYENSDQSVSVISSRKFGALPGAQVSLAEQLKQVCSLLPVTQRKLRSLSS